MNITKLGSNYGKHYVVLNEINYNSLVLSFGIGEDITFDVDLIKLTNCTVYGFDPTIKCLDWIKTQKLPNSFIFFDCGLSNIDGFVNFEPPPNPEFVSYKQSENGIFKFKVKKLSTILKELNCQNKIIDLLKLDIEGSEYCVFENFLKENIYPKQISAEFHKSYEYNINWIKQNKIDNIYNVYYTGDNEFFFYKK